MKTLTINTDETISISRMQMKMLPKICRAGNRQNFMINNKYINNLLKKNKAVGNQKFCYM